jgi:hypothetical protein
MLEMWILQSATIVVALTGSSCPFPRSIRIESSGSSTAFSSLSQSDALLVLRVATKPRKMLSDPARFKIGAGNI